MIPFYIASKLIFNGFWPPTLTSRGVQRNGVWSSCGGLEPSWGQDGPKTFPRGPWDCFWLIFGSILIDFWTNFAWLSDQVWLIFVNLFDRCLDKCCLMFQHILVILLSALLDVWAYVGHVAHVPLSSNPQARWRGWPEGQLDTYTYTMTYT